MMRLLAIIHLLAKFTWSKDLFLENCLCQKDGSKNPILNFQPQSFFFPFSAYHAEASNSEIEI